MGALEISTKTQKENGKGLVEERRRAKVKKEGRGEGLFLSSGDGKQGVER